MSLIIKIGIFIIFSFIICQLGYSQYYIVGQDPASIKWRYLKTEHFKIIYSEDFEKKAQEAANNMEHVWNYDRRTMGFKPKICPIILHNQTIEPNGFTMWAPRRIEFYTCPAQSSYPEDWIKQLCIHEYRHYVQMSKLNQGFTKWLSYILGEQGTGIVLGLYEPTWFMEGDAVTMETVYSNSGRGKLPSFQNELRAQALDKHIYSFDKATFGSYKDFVPDYYEIGYQIVAYARKTYGSKVWDSTLNIIAKRPYIITSFNRGLKNTTGLGKVGLYKETLSFLKDQWTVQEKANTYTAFTKITNSPQSTVHSPQKIQQYWKYKYPAYITDSTIFAERSGLDDIPRFVIINKRTHKEKIIYTPGLYFTDDIISVQQFSHDYTTNNKPGTLTADNISMGKGLIVWTEKVFDKRWDNRSYSVIKIMNLKTGQVRQLTRKTRYFAPAISPDGTRIIASKVTEDNNYSLVLVDINTGRELKEFASSNTNFYITPSWTSDSRKILVIVLNNKGKRIDIVNPETGKSRILLPSSFYDIYNPKQFGKYVIYNSYYSGIDNIYALDTTTSKVYQVTSSKYGAYNADFELGIRNYELGIKNQPTKFIYSDYSANGLDIVEADYKPSEWIPSEDLKDNSVKLYESLLKQEKGNLDNDTVSKETYNSKRYRKLSTLFKFHSWAPAYIDVNNINVKPGVSFLSQNLLSTAVTGLGWYYNTNEKHGREFADITYYGLYPAINLHYDYGKRTHSKNLYDGTTQQFITQIKSDYFQTNLNINSYIPFNLSSGPYIRLVQPMAGYNLSFYQNDNSLIYIPKYKPIRPDWGPTTTPNLFYELFAYNLFKTSSRDISSKWGQVIDVAYSHDPFHANDKSEVLSSSATLYFPGLFNHHSISIYGAYQNKTIGYVDYSDQIRLPYGFTGIDDKQVRMLSFAYRLPLIYPDVSIGPLAYIMRLRGGVFFDYSGYSDYLTTGNHIYRSTGVELVIDTHLFRFIAPINLGVRTIYSPDYKQIGINQTFTFQFLYAIDILNL